MNILHVNTDVQGGAAHACIGLHRALLNHRVASTLLTLQPSTQRIPHHYAYQEMCPNVNRSLLSKAIRIISAGKHWQPSARKNSFIVKVCKEADNFSFLDTSYDITQLEVFRQADIVNLHWAAGFLDWVSFFSVRNQKKVVWTLHDMHPFTGGYHYASNYKGYQSEDRDYPPARQTSIPNMAQQNLKRKKLILQHFKSPLTIVSPSVWMHDVSRSSALFKAYSHQVIPYSIDVDVFRPLEKRLCRELLGLPPDKLIFIFVSQDVNNRRKGFRILLDSIPLLKADQGLLVCSVGNISVEIGSDQVQHIPLQTIQDPRLMALAYNAADAFVIPSLEDNLPNTVLEALACATPVVGFDTGGIKDMVKNGFNGYLSEEKTKEGLRDAIHRFIAHAPDMDLPAIRENTVKRYHPTVQAEAYTKLYHGLVKSTVA